MRLALADGPPPRLLAPGQPDWIGADGVRVGWVIRDVLFLLEGREVVVVPAGDLVDEVAASAAGWTLSSGDAAVRVVGDKAVGALIVDEFDPLELRPGVDCVLAVGVPRHQLSRVHDGEVVAIPDAATRAKFAAPFGTGVGLVWIDLEVIYRLAEGGVPNALGRATGAEALAVGPLGAALVQLATDTVLVPTRAMASRLGEKLLVATARFSPDGEQALVADDDGVVLLGLRLGKVLRRWDGAFTPVGFAPGPVMVDRDTGRLVNAEGEVLLEGLAGAVPACAGDLLVGPGAAGWSLSSGARRDIGPVGEVSGCVLATDGVRVVVVDEQRATLDGASFAHGLGGDSDFVDRVVLSGEQVVIQTVDGEAAAFGLDGTEHWRRHDEHALEEAAHRVPGVVAGDPTEPSEFTVDGVRFPLPVDGFARRGDRLYCWSTEGLLVVV